MTITNEVDRLKNLLLDGERETLSDLERRIELVAEADRLHAADLSQRLQQTIERMERDRRELTARVDQAFERAGSEDRFRANVSTVIGGALRDAEVKNHDEMSRAIAPLVIKTFRTELKNAEQDIVDLLYPHTGRMVQSYVQRAMRDLVEQINRKLDKSVASNSFMLRLKSWSTGRPVAELALAATQRPEVTDLFLIRRGSGELVQRWPAGPELSNSDVHLSGVISAINDFAMNAFKNEGGSIRSFEMDDAQIYLRASPTFLLVAKVAGAELPNAEAMIDETFLTLMERNRELLAPMAGQSEIATEAGKSGPLLQSLATDLDDRIAKKHTDLIGPPGLGFNPLIALAVVIGLPLLVYYAWSMYVDFETARVRSAALQIITTVGETRLVKPELEVGRLGASIRLSGIATSEDVKAQTLERLRAGLPDTFVESRIEVLPNALREVEPQLATVRRDLAGLEVEVIRNNLARAVDRSQRRVDAAIADLGRLGNLSTSDEQRAVVRDVRAAAEQATREIRLYQTLAADARGDAGTLQTLSTPLHQAGQRLTQASAVLSGFVSGHGAASSRQPAQEVAPSDPQRSAEDLSLASERLATLALALVQAAQIKPVERVVMAPLPPPPPAPPPPVPPTARERLQAWVRTHAIFFGNGADYRAQDQADKTLRELADLIRESGALVRIVGYTDERGTQGRNAPLAQQRAEKVVGDLVAAGIPSASVVAVGRSNGPDISPLVGPTSPNRRVEFELGFEGE